MKILLEKLEKIRSYSSMFYDYYCCSY